MSLNSTSTSAMCVSPADGVLQICNRIGDDSRGGPARRVLSIASEVLRLSPRRVRTPFACLRASSAEWGMTMLWTILVVLLVCWAIGLVAHVGGALIHLLL